MVPYQEMQKRAAEFAQLDNILQLQATENAKHAPLEAQPEAWAPSLSWNVEPRLTFAWLDIPGDQPTLAARPPHHHLFIYNVFLQFSILLSMNY